MGFLVTLAAFAGGYVTGAKMGDRPKVLARDALNDVRARAASAVDSARSIASEAAVPLVDTRPVRDVMSTPVESVGLDAPLREAAKQMQRKRIGDIFVIDATGELRGIVTDRDLAVRAVAEERSLDTPVREIMSPIAATVSPTSTVSAALDVMRQHEVRRLPVVEKGRPHGVVSLGDVSRSGGAGDVLADISAAPANN
ncbi:MAG TPA: CBS domain-containing protein [Actinomycetota bacterium]|nr:CBS domain-containing protein [Actinomycetota bacterium]